MNSHSVIHTVEPAPVEMRSEGTRIIHELTMANKPCPLRAMRWLALQHILSWSDTGIVNYGERATLQRKLRSMMTE